MIRQLFILCILLCSGGWAMAQQPAPAPAPGYADTFRIIKIKNADKYSHVATDSLTDLDILVGNVDLKEGNTIFRCDSAVINNRLRIVEAFGRVYINEGDSIITRAGYLQYFSDKQLAILKRNVSVDDGKGKLTTDELQYDMALKIGYYKNGGRIVNGKTILTSKEGYYYPDTKDALFKQGVKLKDPKYDMETDSLYYNTVTQIVRFNSPTTIIDSSGRIIRTNAGFYDMKNGLSQFEGQTVIQDKDITLSGDKVVNDEKNGISQVQGHGVLIDKKNGTIVMANTLFRNTKLGTFLATNKPVMIIKQDKDSIYISADTLFSGRITSLGKYKDSISGRDTLKGVNVVNVSNASDTADNNRYFEAFHNVRIFSDSLQAVSDSLFYSLQDSTFQLFQNPIVWTNDTQVSGDTIFLYTKNKKAERLHVFENSFVVNKVNSRFFNQVKSNTLNGYFRNGDIYYMRAKTNAESIYFIQNEDSSFVGVNKMTGDAIDSYFEDKALKKVVVVKDVKGVMSPIRQTAPENMRLSNFNWFEMKRPKTRAELFE
jgi:lipopolysaccharide export system protein LptA